MGVTLKSLLSIFTLITSIETIAAFMMRPVIFFASSSSDDRSILYRIKAYNSNGDMGIGSGLVNDIISTGNSFSQNLPPSVMKNGGRITMVGSGPGDPDLLTLAAHRILSDPDILVISDRLVSKEILGIIRGECRIARKLPGCADAAQEEVRYTIRQHCDCP